MIEKILKRLTALVLAAVLLTLCACGGGDTPEYDRRTLTVWVYSDEYKEDMQRAFNEAFTAIDWRLDIKTVAASEMQSLLGGSLTAEEMPDIFMLSPDTLCKYVESDITADMAVYGIEPDDSRYYTYTIEAGKDSQGRIKALCWQPDPGLFFYRRSIAKYYLGTDDPDEIQAMISDWDGFYDTAKKLSELSEGKTRMVMGVEDLMMPYLADVPLVSGGAVSVSGKAVQFMEYCRKMASEGLIYDAEQWSEAWLAGISDPQGVFGYFSSGLGMKDILIKACGGTIAGEGSYGDWAAVIGPQPYNWGGCWLAAYSGSDMQEEAKLFLEYFICEEEAMRVNCLIDGTFSANRTVVEQIKFDSQFSESFLSAQNYYSMLAQSANLITMDNLTQYDSVVRPIFSSCVNEYAFGDRTYEQALELFVRTVQAVYPELTAS